MSNTQHQSSSPLRQRSLGFDTTSPEFRGKALKGQRRMLKDARSRTSYYSCIALLGIVITAWGRRSIEFMIKSQRLLAETIKFVSSIQHRVPDLDDIELPEPPPVLQTTTVYALWSGALTCCLVYQVVNVVVYFTTRNIALGHALPRDQSRRGWLRFDRRIRIYVWIMAAILPSLLLAALSLFLSGFSALLFSQEYTIPGWLLAFMSNVIVVQLAYALVYQTYLSQHPLSHELQIPPDPAFQGDTRDLEDAMILYSSLRKGSFKHLSKCSGDHVVDVVRKMLSRLLHRPVPTLNENFPDLWHTTLEARAAIARVIVGRFNHEVGLWEASPSPEDSACWQPWMAEGISCIDAMLSSAPGAMQFELAPLPVALGSGVVILSLLAQNTQIAKQVLLSLTDRRVSSLKYYYISSAKQTYRLIALDNLSVAYRELESDPSISTLGEIKNTKRMLDSWLQTLSFDMGSDSS